MKSILPSQPILHSYMVYWNRLLYSGKAVPPKTFLSASELMSFVKKTKGAVYFINSDIDKLPANVVVLLQ